MKYFIVIITFIVAGNMSLYSGNCGQSISCTDAAYPFRFCDDYGNIRTLCASDPFSHTDQFYPEFYIPLKMNNNVQPICLQFDDSGPIEIGVKICGDQTCSSDLVYEKKDFITDMKSAAYDWNCLCGKQDDDCGCTINVGFTEDPFKFEDPEEQPAANTVDQYPEKVIKKCEIQCEDLNIYLNYTEEFTNKSNATKYTGTDYELYYGGNFFVTSGVANNWPAGLSGYKPDAYNLETVLMNQLGRIFGLSGDPYYGSCYSGGVMDDLRPEPEGAKEDLSDDDKCMFVKLYCTTLPVEDDNYDNSDIDHYNYPNPFDTKTNIRFKVTNDLASHVTIRIFNNLGNIVCEVTDKYYDNGTHDIVFDSANLAAGIYYYTIKINNKMSFYKMQIVK